MSSKNLVLRIVYIDADTDDQLTKEARKTGESRSDLLNQYLLAGMKLAEDQEAPTTSRKVRSSKKKHANKKFKKRK